MTTHHVTKALCTDLDWGDRTPGIIQSEATDARDLGARWIRITINWRDLQPKRDVWSEWWITYIGQVISTAGAKGLSVLAVIGNGFPDWSDKNDPTDFAEFVAYCVKRFPRVNAFEIWNEPNNERFWPSPDPKMYAAFLQAASHAIHTVSSAMVIYGGLAGRGLGVADTDFLYKSLTSQSFWNIHAVAIHPYAPTPVDVQRVWRDYRKALQGHFGGPLWLTEIGWSTSAESHGEWMAPVVESIQARYLSDTYQLASRDNAGVTFISWYCQRNNYWQHDDPSSIEAGFGLSRANRLRKPAYHVFQSIV